MGHLEVVMKHSKSTKNTEMYEEVIEYGEQAFLGTQYIQKAAFKDDGKYPEEITIKVEWD